MRLFFIEKKRKNQIYKAKTKLKEGVILIGKGKNIKAAFFRKVSEMNEWLSGEGAEFIIINIIHRTKSNEYLDGFVIIYSIEEIDKN